MNIENLKQLALAATPGPWWIDSHGHAMVSHSDTHNCELIFQTDDSMGPAIRHESTGKLSHWRNDCDADYIASANPKVILDLIAQRDELLAAFKKYGRHHHGCASSYPGMAQLKCDCGFADQIAKCEAQS